MLRLLVRRKSEEERRDELLSAYLDGELGERERQRLEARLAQDPALRAELRALHQTVSLMHELPQVAAPRNFILSRSLVEVQQPAARPEPRALRPSSEQARRAWAAPLLTAATAVVSLLFVVVLVGDLLLPGIGGLASAPEPMGLSKEVPQIALEAAPTGDEVEIEREVAPSPTSAPMAAEAPPEEPEMAAEEKQEAKVERESAPSPTPAPTLVAEAPREKPEMAAEEEEEAIEGIGADEAALETGTPSAFTATGGGGPTEEAAALAAPTGDSGAALTPTIPAEAPAVAEEPAEEELRLLEPTPGEIEVTPPSTVVEERGLTPSGRGRLPWEVLEVGLGLAAVVLTFSTIRAWRVRRR
jgi:hypothetical protein